MKMRHYAAMTFALAAAPFAAMADSISPDSYAATLNVGESVTINKTVTISAEATGLVDVFFLADTTGSMSGPIAAIRTNAISALNTIVATNPGVDFRFATGEYKDAPFDPYIYRKNSDIDDGADAAANRTAAVNGINLWSASGGADGPEGQVYALNFAATTTDWRPGSQRVLIWFGDAPGHTPRNGIDEATAIAALNANGVEVHALGTNTGYPNDLNNDCAQFGFTDGPGCSAGQATRITDATGGDYVSGITSAGIVAAIQSAIDTAVNTYATVALDLTEVPVGVTVTSTPAGYSGSFDRSVERTFGFNVTFTGDAPGVYSFPIYALLDGRRVATESDRITVTGDAPIPEPGTVALLSLGLAGLWSARRRKLV